MFEETVLNAAYGLLLVAAFTRTLGRFRLLLIVSSLIFVVFGAIISSPSIVIWNLIIAGLNVYRLGKDVLASRAISLTADELAVRDRYFAGVSDFDFNALWVSGRTVTHDSTVIISDRSQPEWVAMVLDGQVEIQRDGICERSVGQGALLGEMSYVSGDPATVDVVALGRVTVREWDQRHLRLLDQTHPPSAKVLDRLIARDLAAKARV